MILCPVLPKDQTEQSLLDFRGLFVLNSVMERGCCYARSKGHNFQFEHQEPYSSDCTYWKVDPSVEEIRTVWSTLG